MAGLDIGMSNWSFRYITISLYTMSKTTAIIFILLFSVLFSLQQLKFSIVFIIGLISTGLFLFTYKSAQFHLLGFLLVEIAALCGGLRWTLSQFIMQKKEIGLNNPVDMMYYIQPWMIVTTFPLVLAFEAGCNDTQGKNLLVVDSAVLGEALPFILLGGVVSFFMELAEYLLLFYTSGLTLGICGVVKEVAILVFAHFINGDQMSALNFAGLFVCAVGISLHAREKMQKSNTGGDIGEDFTKNQWSTTTDFSIEGQRSSAIGLKMASSEKNVIGKETSDEAPLLNEIDTADFSAVL